MRTTAVFQRLSVVAAIVAALVFPPTIRAAVSQEITFDPIGNRTTGQALSFTVTPSSSSGLPVSLAASGSCSVDGFTISILDKGTCSLTATQDGNEDWEPAQSVTRTFTIIRALLSNKTLTFRTADGKPAEGLKLRWHTADRAYSSAATATTNSAGQVKYSKIPGGAIVFEWWGTAGVWKIADVEDAESTVLTIGAANSVVTVGPGLDQYPTDLRVRVELENGQPVVGAQVVAVCNYNCQYLPWVELNSNTCQASAWSLTTCVREQRTDLFGYAQFIVPKRIDGTGYRAFASFVDGDLSQSTPFNGWGNDFAAGSVTVVFDQLPVVEMETDASTVDYAAAQTISVVALDSDGTPISGRVLTLSSSSRGATADCVLCDPVSVLAATAPTPRRLRWQSDSFGTSDMQISASGTSCIGRRVTATTNSAGRATFKVCPVKTATWSVDGRSIVGSAGVRLTVQLSPTAPRTLVATPKTGSVSLTWAAPAKANASAVTDYIVQYRLQGATTWITFRDGTSTARKATVTGLALGQVYEFRVAAKNKSGTGIWSANILASPQ